MSKTEKDLIDTVHVMNGCLHVERLVGFCEKLAIASGDGSGGEVDFVGDQADGNALIGSLSYIVDPAAHGFKGGPAGDIIDHQCSQGVLVVPTSMLPYPLVMERKCSCPAVSQICSFTLWVASTCTFLEQ